MALEDFSEQVSLLPIGDLNYEKGIILLYESRNELAIAYTILAIKKAKAGIIGNSWYKQVEDD